MADNDSNGGASPAPAPVAADNASPNNNGGQDYQEDVRERSPVDTRRDGDERAGGEDTMMDRERSPAYGRQEERRDDRREESRRDDRERSPRRKPPPPPPGRDVSRLPSTASKEHSCANSMLVFVSAKLKYQMSLDASVSPSGQETSIWKMSSTDTDTSRALLSSTTRG
jgi:hypothetical protein